MGAEIVRAMSHVISQGWAMYWGTSRWSSVEISEAYNNCRQFNCPTAICEQAEYHFLCREKIEISLPEVYNKLGSSVTQTCQKMIKKKKKKEKKIIHVSTYIYIYIHIF